MYLPLLEGYDAVQTVIRISIWKYKIKMGGCEKMTDL